jgi:hypothetical protein
VHVQRARDSMPGGGMRKLAENLLHIAGNTQVGAAPPSYAVNAYLSQNRP